MKKLTLFKMETFAKPEGERLLSRFLMVGLMNTIFGYISYPVIYLSLDTLNLHYLFILVIAQSICISFSYISNKFLVFKTRGNIHKEVAHFSLFHVGHLGLNYVFLLLVVGYLEIHPILAQVSYATVVVCTSFIWYKHVVFRGK